MAYVKTLGNFLIAFSKLISLCQFLRVLFDFYQDFKKNNNECSFYQINLYRLFKLVLNITTCNVKKFQFYMLPYLHSWPHWCLAALHSHVWCFSHSCQSAKIEKKTKIWTARKHLIHCLCKTYSSYNKKSSFWFCFNTINRETNNNIYIHTYTYMARCYG